MRVYLAAPYQVRDWLRRRAEEVEEQGMTISSSWLKQTHSIGSSITGAAPGLSVADVRRDAVADLADIRSADALVVFTASTAGCSGGGGRHVETGFALALGKPILVVGQAEHIFHRMGSPVELHTDWPSALRSLRGMRG